MPKEIVNNRINYFQSDGRVIQHDIWLNQPVTTDSSPTFANLQLTGDAVVEGNLYVQGNTTILNTNIIEFTDNIVVLNNNETGAGITLNQGGIELDRGLLENFRFVYDETYQNFRVGLVSNLQPVAIRQDIPLSNGVMIWNPTTLRIESQNNIDIDMKFTSNLNATSSTYASVIFSGGLGIKKDVFMDGRLNLVGTNLPNYSSIYTDLTTNSCNIESVQNINLTPNVNVKIPFDKALIFGNTNQSIVASSNGNNLSISSNGHINLTPASGKKVAIPNQIPLVLSTDNEKIYTDAGLNLILESSQDIILKPANGAGVKTVQIPVSTPLTFGGANQQLTSNISGDLTIAAGNNILMNPGPSLNVRIPTDNGIKFGGGGNQRIFSNALNELQLLSTGDIYLTPTQGFKVNIPSNVSLAFGGNTQTVVANTSGTLSVNAQNEFNIITKLHVSNTTDSSSASNGSVFIDGGVGIKKNIVCEKSVLINSSSANALSVNSTLFNIDTSGLGKVGILSGEGLELNSTNLSDARKLLALNSQFDPTDGYYIGRGLVANRDLSVNLPLYSAYSNSGSRSRFSICNNNTNLFSVESETGNVVSIGAFTLNNTQDAISSTEASFVVLGGLGIVKSIVTTGKINNSVDSTTALQVKTASGTMLFNINSITPSLTINQKTLIDSLNVNAFTITDTLSNTAFNVDTILHKITNSYQNIFTDNSTSINSSTGSSIFNGGVGIQGSLNVGSNSSFRNGVNMLNSNITNLLDPSLPQDAATKAYVDLVKQGLYVKDSVKAATTQAQNLLLDFVIGNLIDNYTLALNDRILIKDQSNQVENGIYKITNSTPIRTDDLNTGSTAGGTFTFVQTGDVNGNLGFLCNSLPPNDIVGTDNLNYTQFTGLGQVNAGLGLSKTFNTLDVNVDNFSFEINSDILRLSSSGLGLGMTGGSGVALQTATNQSHVTKLGTINTGVWQGTVVAVNYGGTGRSLLPVGNVLFGNGTGQVGVDNKLFYNTTLSRLGLGTGNPLQDFHIKNINKATIFIEADSDGSNNTASPEIILGYATTNTSTIAMTRTVDQYNIGSIPDTLMISNDQLDSSSTIQLGTKQFVRMTILDNGNIGINTTTPSYKLDVNGTLNATGLITFTNNAISAFSSASVLMNGGLTILNTTNSSNVNNGGGFTVLGGASFVKDIYIGQHLYGNTSSFNYTSILATDNAINSTTGSLKTIGGITIMTSTDSFNSTNGGGLLVIGGGAIKRRLFVGDTLSAEQDTFLGNLHFSSTSNDNYLESPNVSRTTNSINPIHYRQYNNTSANILTLHDNGIILNESKEIQLGGTLGSLNSFKLYYTPNNLNIIPNTTGFNLNIGTTGALSNVNIVSANGSIYWDTSLDQLKLLKSTVNFANTTSSVVFSTPNSSGNMFINTSGGNNTVNIGKNSVGGQLNVILSNDIGDSFVSFLPSNTTSSSLNVTNNVISQYNGPVFMNDRVEMSGKALHQTIQNTSGNNLWVYCGQLNNGTTGYTELELYNGNKNTLLTSGLRLQVSIQGTNCTANHNHYGNTQFNSLDKGISYIYQDVNDYHLFILLAPLSTTTIDIKYQHHTKFLLSNEGYSTLPNGSVSSFSGWTEFYKTNIESNLVYSFGDTTIEGHNINLAANLPVINYNNNLTTVSRDIGILLQRYQKDNDTNIGDIITDTPFFINTIPDQTGVPLNQIKFSTTANVSNDYYNGCWLNISNQSRQIISYNGTLQVATLSSPFTTQSSTGNTVNVFNKSYVASYYDETSKYMSFSYSQSKNDIISNQNVNLRANHLYLTDTTLSLNNSTGSLRTLGGITINNTNDASSITQGNALMVSGGASIQRRLFVGDNIAIGSNVFNPTSSLHVNQNVSGLTLQHSTHSFVDLVENTSGNRYGILSKNNLFHLTNTNLDVTPDLANKAFTINSSGNIGINTTNISTLLTLKNSNFISTDSTSGYLGLSGTNSTVNSSRITLDYNSIKMYSKIADISMYTGNDVLTMNLNNTGIVHIYSTHTSDNKTTGALLVDGGLTITCNKNAQSFTEGGSLYTDGGASINKDVYIGGSLFISGALNAGGSVTTPVIIFSNALNCTFNSYVNNKLVTVSNYGILDVAFSVNPTAGSLNSQIEFDLPSRTTNFTNRGDVILSVSGYSDNTNVNVLFNVIAVGIVGTTRALLKFQSIDTTLHYFQLKATYTLA